MNYSWHCHLQLLETTISTRASFLHQGFNNSDKSLPKLSEQVTGCKALLLSPMYVYLQEAEKLLMISSQLHLLVFLASKQDSCKHNKLLLTDLRV